ncbi:uncharacterized protein (TIGR02611 family) [Kineosphaera limosa]|uniref:TIGR02611 family protein n=1 Tax=Kineosphaera limosa TaxID=111564 RepID=UPI00031D6716|nr:TIGR02611 family protein [Kineosphaera limosa]NYD98896.1 uncharacterized protein (TIGR02611 family) [Kineosphaera limosa]
MDERVGTGEVVTSPDQPRVRALRSGEAAPPYPGTTAAGTPDASAAMSDSPGEPSGAGTDPSQRAAGGASGGIDPDLASRPMLGPDWAWRRRLRERRATYHAYRMGVAALGVTVVIVGLILVPLPGPGWLIVFCGLAILATEFHWAKRLHQYVSARLREWNDWIMAQPVWVRLALAAGTFLLVVAFFWVVLKVVGIPSLVPEWITHYLRTYAAL